MKKIFLILLPAAVLALLFVGCADEPVAAPQPASVAAAPPPPLIASQPAPSVAIATATNATSPTSIPPREKDPGLRRSTYTPRIYPVDERGFSPVDEALAKAYAREEIITNDDDGSLNPYVLKVITGYPLDGS